MWSPSRSAARADQSFDAVERIVEPTLDAPDADCLLCLARDALEPSAGFAKRDACDEL